MGGTKIAYTIVTGHARDAMTADDTREDDHIDTVEHGTAQRSVGVRWRQLVLLAGLVGVLGAGAAWLAAGDPRLPATDSQNAQSQSASAPATEPRLANIAMVPAAPEPEREHGREPVEVTWPEFDIQYPKPPKPDVRTVNVGRGDTLMGVLTDAGLSTNDATGIITALDGVFDPRKLRAGQELALTFKVDGSPEPELTALRFDTAVDRFVEVSAHPGGFAAQELERALTPELRGAKATIDSSLYAAGLQAGVPPAVLVDLIQVYSFSVDFQRDIHGGDSFEVMYEDHVDEDGDVVRQSDILYASLTLRGETERLWRYETSKGEVDYFNEKGESVRRMLMRTPIDGARLSSNFGMRKHPILGYSRMHTGTDFAAPRGTPIYASGNGTVAFAGRKGGYGNYIKIRHNGSYATAYAHMKGFAKGIKRGARVRQGQTIGYVGSTGRSTGPHLHYEVHYNGKAVNPMALKLPTGQKLKGEELERFQVARAELERQFAKLGREVEVAATANGPAADACEAPAAAEKSSDDGC